METQKQDWDPDVRLADASEGLPPSAAQAAGAASRISRELKAHVPFTLFGTLTAVTILVTFIAAGLRAPVTVKKPGVEP